MIHGVEERMNALEYRMAKKELENQKVLIERLLFLEKMNFELEQKA